MQLMAEVPGIRAISSLEELDMEFAHENVWERAKSIRFRPDLPDSLEDPFSEAYRDRQVALYKHLAGRDYDAVRDEKTEFNVEWSAKRPFPYQLSPNAVGDQLVMQGFVMQRLPLTSGSILEFGPGWGNLTLHLALSGFDVTAVDINPMFAELIERRAELASVSIKTHASDMLEFEPEKQYDAVLFYECFHHCADHMQMLRKLKRLVKPGGYLILGEEPVYEEPTWAVPYPWGIRLDGWTVYCIRKLGWFELGFTREYFDEALRRSGWNAEFHRSNDIPYLCMYVATHAEIAPEEPLAILSS